MLTKYVINREIRPNDGRHHDIKRLRIVGSEYNSQLAENADSEKEQRQPNEDNEVNKLVLNFRQYGMLSPYPENPEEWKLLALRKRSRIQEIISVNDSILLSLQHSGICCVFKRQVGNSKYRQHGYLNHKPDEIIRSLFHNRTAQSIVIVSVYPADKKAILKCRSINIKDIEDGLFNMSKPILSQEVLGYPGWIELCEVNARILTYSAETQIYKLWDLGNDYPFLYQITPARGEKLIDVKASPGFLLLIYEPIVQSSTKTQRISLVDIQDGKELYSLNHVLKTRIEVVEQFCDSILIKEQDNGLVIHNVRKHCSVEYLTHHQQPSYMDVPMSSSRLNAFTFLHGSRIFLTFQSGGRVISFDSYGVEIAVVHGGEDISKGLAGHPSPPVNSIVLVARDQETLLCVRPYSSESLPSTYRCCVEFKHVLTGRLLAKVPIPYHGNEISCICYDEEKMMLFVGTRDGLIHSFC